MPRSSMDLHTGGYSYKQELEKWKKIGSEITSNLELQMALYFNVIFFPFWLVTTIFMLMQKYDSLHNLYQVITTIVLIILIPMEAFRLYLGYVGNLLEKIPELAGFWMLSLILQCPLQLFLLVNRGTSSQPAEKSVQFVMCVMLFVELIFGFIALRKISRHRANNFHLTQIRFSTNLTSSTTAVNELSIKSE
ncbi:transmembrane protein 17-like [Planococcus citri]|uniref:transmembrane protein 17-like n=1 Tax=Planococcus citri TaxID=170843 RepID=UPI0031F8035F